MSTQNLKELLVEAFQLEKELIELVKDCMKDIFQDEYIGVSYDLESDLEHGLQHAGCLQSLQYYKDRVSDVKKHREQIAKNKLKAE